MRQISDSLVTHHEQWYAKRPAYIARMMTRANRYLYYITSEVERRGMPAEIALLPMIESAFNPGAYSTSNASGIWQFIPSTGKNFGMRQNWWYDGRRDIIGATNGALDYLEKLHTMFGDWELALAAYNWGDSVLTYKNNLENYDKPLVSWQAYRAKKGERLDHLAPRFGLTLERLKSVNGLSARDNLSDGEALLVPLNGEVAENEGEFEAFNMHLHPTAKINRNGASIKYTAHSDEPLDKLASRYHVSVASLKNWHSKPKGRAKPTSRARTKPAHNRHR